MVRVKIDYYPHDAQMPFHKDRYKIRFRGLIAGTGCLPIDTQVWTPDGLKSMNEVKRVYSWNLIKKRLEVKKATYSPSGMKPIYLIETGVGEMWCSPEHRWFVQGGVVKRTTDLKTGDRLMMVRSTINGDWTKDSSREEWKLDEYRQGAIHRVLLQPEIQHSKDGEVAGGRSEAYSSSLEVLGHPLSELRGAVQDRKRYGETDRSSPSRNDRGKPQKEQKKLSEDSKENLRMEVHELRENADKRALRLGGSSQGWGQYEQRCREPYDPLPRMSLQNTRITRISLLEKQKETGDLQVEDNPNFILSNGVITHNSGKTLAGAKESLDWAWESPNSQGLIAAPAFRKFREVIIPCIEKLLNAKIDYTPFFTNFNRAEMSLDVFNGSKIWMIGLDKAEAAEGMNLDWAWIDEARLVPKFGEAWNSIQRRLRGSGLGSPLDDKVPEKAVGAWVTTTPDGPGSSLHKFFEGRERDPESKVYRMSMDDNRDNLSADYIEGMKRTHSGGFYDRFILGLFATISAGAYEFDYAIHVQDFERLFKEAFGFDHNGL